MENYQPIAEQGYKAIGPNIESDLRFHTDSAELFFKQISGRQLMYDAFASKSGKPSDLTGMRLVDIGSRAELSDILTGNLHEGELPVAIKVVHPNIDKDVYAVFFSGG